MEQIGLFFTERSSWIYMGLGFCTLVLLAITLHRIKQNLRQMNKLTETAEHIRIQLEHFVEVNVQEKEILENQQELEPETTQPEELLNAVLEEVFP